MSFVTFALTFVCTGRSVGSRYESITAPRYNEDNGYDDRRQCRVVHGLCNTYQTRSGDAAIKMWINNERWNETCLESIISNSVYMPVCYRQAKRNESEIESCAQIESCLHNHTEQILSDGRHQISN